MRVLVVEDERHVASVFLDTLAQLGHRPHVVPTAEEALERLTADRPDAIILDVDLPGMNGVEFLRVAPLKESGVPVVAVSGIASEVLARECLRLGAFDFVWKPVSLDRLREILMYLEDRARPATAGDGRLERRRAARAPIEGAVRIIADDGSQWDGMSVDVSPFSIRVRSDAHPPDRSAVNVEFRPPDDGPPIRARALVVRRGEDSALYFVNLGDEDFRRLTVLVQRTLVR